MIKFCVILSSELTLRAFLVDQLQELGKIYALTVVINTSNDNLLSDLEIKGTLKKIEIVRKISILWDIVALYQLIRLFSKEKFLFIHSFTPKAGLLSSIAGFFCKIKLRIHTFTGQVWSSKSGASRYLLKIPDSIIARLSTHILVDGPLQLLFLENESVIKCGKAIVLGEGSLGGVDLSRFFPNIEARRILRNQESLLDDEIIFLFVGRLNRDKGIIELVKAFELIAGGNSSLHLWIVGPDEENLINEIRSSIKKLDKQFKYVGYVSQPEKYMMTSDILCVPSHREGFATVVIESASVGIPSIGSEIYGIADAIVNGKTGILFKQGDIEEISKTMLTLAKNKHLRQTLGKNALMRATEKFEKRKVTANLLKFYADILKTLN
jgi:glycosyltransferase involved in cell wall biosynthesis